eukprot:2347501-Rhodomonas_salina.5
MACSQWARACIELGILRYLMVFLIPAPSYEANLKLPAGLRYEIAYKITLCRRIAGACVSFRGANSRRRKLFS